ncbi:hypothetical protein FGADI_12587 [Fusarium gaditjirri]|uniref:Uncharacterized protein n=1 Tax=Fusarium gaditjirri TaxID=282569 RepID=A0A8H4WN53_9HYPO|nr:hypothetical protein FGADI_12587 [Fusarium gaditjirri]
MAAAPDMAPLKSILAFNQIVEQVARYAQRLADIRSPAQNHQEDVQAVYAKLRTTWERISKSSHVSEREKLEAEIQSHITKLEKLRQNYELGKQDAEGEYEHQVDIVVKALCEALVESTSTFLSCHKDE